MITVSYSGVHQAYQIALAAQQAGALDEFLCSFYDAPGKWGGRLSKLLGSATLKNRSLVGIDASRVNEYPWPELKFKLWSRLFNLESNAWIAASQAFDHWAAKQLLGSDSRLVYGAENCSYETFKAAKQKGMCCFYDCPGHNAELLEATTREASKRSGIPFASAGDTPEIARRKAVEIELADRVLTYSDFHTRGVLERGVPREKIVEIPLWTDPDFWHPPKEPRQRTKPLRILFVGGVNLRKGVPFLVEATRKLAPHVSLTLIGSQDKDTVSYLKGATSFVHAPGPVHKHRLREIYWEHDVFVLPSLGDSFGFVAMEAMACGLPLIITNHCGAPVPDERWRVPIMDSAAIAERLRYFLDQPEQIAIQGQRARAFACNYTPERFRSRISDAFQDILTGTTNFGLPTGK